MGMQALAVAYGARIQHAPEPIHGRLSQIRHTDHKLFQNIPSGMPAYYTLSPLHGAMRYLCLRSKLLLSPTHFTKLRPVALPVCPDLQLCMYMRQQMRV